MSLDSSRWVEISVQAETEAVDDLIGLFSRHCTGGAAVEDQRRGPRWSENERVVVKGFVDEGDEDTLRKLEIALLLLSRSAGISEPQTRVLEPADWAEAWKAFFPPLPIGQSLVVVPTWLEHTPENGRRALRLDPGMAFGTGLHATTRLCLEVLERVIEPGMDVLDVGTGSGILSIAALLLGAQHVDAIDTDPVSIRVARENGVLNGVADRMRIVQATLPTLASGTVPVLQSGPYDLLLVNILAEVIIDMAPGFADYLRTEGRIVVSGIIADKAAAVREALNAHGLSVREELEQDGWVAQVASKVV